MYKNNSNYLVSQVIIQEFKMIAEQNKNNYYFHHDEKLSPFTYYRKNNNKVINKINNKN